MTKHPPEQWLITKPVSPVAPEGSAGPAAAINASITPRRLFVSGHSLVDLPFPEMLGGLFKTTGTFERWERKYQMGSSIKDRGPVAMPGGPYDALLITEMHSLISVLAWHDTAAQLRLWHDPLLRENPAARTYFFVPWLTVDDLDQPEQWLAYEAAASHVWRCTVAAANQLEPQRGESQQIIVLPANEALAYLVKQLQGRANYGAAVRTIFSDRVHLTPLGHFYSALVSYLALGGQVEALTAAWNSAPPQGIALAQAQELLAVASAFHQEQAQPTRVLDPARCADFMRSSFFDDFWRYSQRVLKSEGVSSSAAAWRTWKTRRAAKSLVLN